MGLKDIKTYNQVPPPGPERETFFWTSASFSTTVGKPYPFKLSDFKGTFYVDVLALQAEHPVAVTLSQIDGVKGRVLISRAVVLDTTPYKLHIPAVLGNSWRVLPSDTFELKIEQLLGVDYKPGVCEVYVKFTGVWGRDEKDEGFRPTIQEVS